MHPRQSRANATLRVLAYGVLTLFALTGALLGLAFAFPAWGRNPNSSTILYFPPQAIAAAYVGVFALGLAALLSLLALTASFSRKRHAWTLAFLMALALCIPGPALAYDYVRHAGLLHIPLEQQAIAAISSLIAFAALPALVLRYARSPRRSAAVSATVGQPPIHDGT